MSLPRWLGRINKRVFNPLEIRRGKRAVLTHAGRRSGRLYKTPLDAHSVENGYVFFVNYGVGCDWVQNILAAGKAGLIIGDQNYDLDQPRLISDEEAAQSLPPGTKRPPRVPRDRRLSADGSGDVSWLAASTALTSGRRGCSFCLGPRPAPPKNCPHRLDAKVVGGQELNCVVARSRKTAPKANCPAGSGDHGQRHMLLVVLPETRYATRGDVHIAYQVTGNGPIDVVLVSVWFSHLEARWEIPAFAHLLNRLGAFSRLVSFDKYGIGLSDPAPPGAMPSLEEWMDDVRTVMDAVGIPQAAFVGAADGGMMAALFAATYPERVTSLVLANSTARMSQAVDYPTGVPSGVQEALIGMVEQGWGGIEPGGRHQPKSGGRPGRPGPMGPLSPDVR